MMINEVDDGLIIITADAGMFVPKMLYEGIDKKLTDNMESFKLMFLSFSVDSENDLISISDDVETVTINLSELTPWFEM
jgi:hypothetical protein